jgi:hypothetical protein
VPPTTLSSSIEGTSQVDTLFIASSSYESRRVVSKLTIRNRESDYKSIINATSRAHTGQILHISPSSQSALGQKHRLYIFILIENIGYSCGIGKVGFRRCLGISRVGGDFLQSMIFFYISRMSKKENLCVYTVIF